MMRGTVALILCAAALMFTAACTMEEIKASGTIAARSLCRSARNCTVNDQPPP